MLSPTVVLQSPYSLISPTCAVISTVASSALCSLISRFSATSTSCADHNSERRYVAPTNTSNGEVFHSSAGCHICEKYGYHTHEYNIGRIPNKNQVKSWWSIKQTWKHHPHFSSVYNTKKVNYCTLTSHLALPVNYCGGSLPKLGTTAEKTITIQSTLT